MGMTSAVDSSNLSSSFGSSTMEDEWWRRWFEIGNASAANHTVDVLSASCFGHIDTIACVRSSAISILGIITAIVAFARIMALHANQPSHLRLLLYYVLFVHCIGGSLEFAFGWMTSVALFISYSKSIELLIICYFYLDIASKMMHWSSTAGKRLCFLALFMMFTYFTLFLVLGMLLSIEPWTDCHAPYWIWFSVGEWITVQLMVGSFWLILSRISRISASPNMQNSQRNDLYSLFCTFETSAVADLAYHISLFMLADDEKGCSGVFNHDQWIYTALKAPYDLISFLLPVWAILYVFRTTSKREMIENGSTESLFSTGTRTSASSIAEVVVVRNWRRRYRPLTQPSPTDGPVFPGRRQRLAPRLRPVSSAPMLSAIGRRASISRSLVSSPLYSIPEELQQPYYHEVEVEVEHNPLVVGSVDAMSTSAYMGDE